MPLLNRSNAIGVSVDVQEKLVGVMHNHESLLKNLEILLHGWTECSMPLIISEQYPKGLGPTVESLQTFKTKATVIEKNSFSCMPHAGFKDALTSSACRQVVLFGIESHVCVLQTALELIDAGYEVHLPHDGVSSRNEANRTWACERMQQAGCIITNTESILFELLRDTSAAEFKTISKLMR